MDGYLCETTRGSRLCMRTSFEAIQKEAKSLMDHDIYR